MSFRVTCPKCHTAAALPDAYRGKPLRCKKCGQPFVAGAPAARKAAAAPPATNSPSPGKPPRRRFVVAAVAAALVGAVVGFPTVYFLLKKDAPPDDVAAAPSDTARGPDTSRVTPRAPTTKQEKPRDTGTKSPPVAAPVAWEDFTSRDWGFSARFPGVPRVTSAPNPGGRRRQTFTASMPVSADRKPVMFTLACDEHDPGATADAAAFLAARADELGPEGRQQTALKLAGFPGVEVRGAAHEVEGGAGTTTHRFYVVRTRSYHLVAAGPAGKDVPPLFEQFLDSFKLLDPGEPPPPPDNSFRGRVLAWVRENAVLGDTVAEKVKELLGTAKDGFGFTLALGAGLVKSGKPMLLAGWGGQLFPFELSAEQVGALKLGERNFLVRTFPDPSRPRPEKPPFTLSDLKINAAGAGVTGTTAYRRGESPGGAVVVRFLYAMGPALYRRSQPVDPKAESGSLTLRGPAVAELDPQFRGPVVVFVEVCAAEGAAQQDRVLSNPVAALVAPPAGPPKDGLAGLQLAVPDGWTANYNKFLGAWEVKKPPPTTRSEAEELRIEECPEDARTPAAYAEGLKKKDFLNAEVPGFVEVGAKEDLPDGFVFKGVVKKFPNPTPPTLGLVAVRDVGGLKVRCYSANLRATKDRPEGSREELLKMFREATFGPPK